MPTLDDIASALGDSTNNTTAFAQNNTDLYYLDNVSIDFDKGNTYQGTIDKYDVGSLVGSAGYRVRVYANGVGNEYKNKIYEVSFDDTIGDISKSSFTSNNDYRTTWYTTGKSTGGPTGVIVSVSDGIRSEIIESKTKPIEEAIYISIESIVEDFGLIVNVREDYGTGIKWEYYLNGDKKKEYNAKISDPNINPASYKFDGGDGYIAGGGPYDIKVSVEGENGYFSSAFADYDDGSGGGGGGDGWGIDGVSAQKVDSTTYSCSVGVSGGDPPYSYSWSSDAKGSFDDPTAQNPEFNATFEPAEGDKVYVDVEDSDVATDSGSAKL